MPKYSLFKTVLVLAFILLWNSAAFADVAPPRGTKRIPVHYKFKAPKDQKKYVYLWMTSSQLRSKSLLLSPIVWGKKMLTSQGYRETTELLSFSPKQAKALLSLLLGQDKLSKMKPETQLEWLRTLKFDESKNKKQKPNPKKALILSKMSKKNGLQLTKYLRKETSASRLSLASKTLIAKLSPTTYELRVVKIIRTEKNKIVWKAEDKIEHDKGNYVVPTIVGKSSYLLTRWKWVIAGFLLALIAAIVYKQRRKS